MRRLFNWALPVGVFAFVLINAGTDPSHAQEQAGSYSNAGVGRHRCGIPVGTSGVHITFASSGPAYAAALVAMADDIKNDADAFRDSIAKGYVKGVWKPGLKAAFISTQHHGQMLLVRGADGYFCGVAICSFDAFTLINGKWVNKPKLLTDFGDDVYLYNTKRDFPDLSSAPVIEDATYVNRLNQELERYEYCTTVTRISMAYDSGRFVVPVLINNTITLNFTVDSGADDVSVPADVVLTLIRAGTISNTDFTGSATYTMADGSRVPSATFTIKTLKVGNVIVKNVGASVASPQGELLLGQSFLQQFKTWSIDNATHELVLQ